MTRGGRLSLWYDSKMIEKLGDALIFMAWCLAGIIVIYIVGQNISKGPEVCEPEWHNLWCLGENWQGSGQ